MRNRERLLLAILLCGLAIGIGLNCAASHDSQGAAPADDDASPADGGPLTDNGNGTATDPATGLLWQIAAPAVPRFWTDAQAYCASLNLAGHGDWRLPDIDELRSLIRGCPATEPGSGGQCGVTAQCLDESCGEWCLGCNGAGPGTDGCFWPPQLGGECEAYWSSSLVAEMTDRAWDIEFNYGGTIEDYQTEIEPLILARCVR
jgi:hypothetical protein